jgi:hypothetical protein
MFAIRTARQRRKHTHSRRDDIGLDSIAAVDSDRAAAAEAGQIARSIAPTVNAAS